MTIGELKYSEDVDMWIASHYSFFPVDEAQVKRFFTIHKKKFKTYGFYLTYPGDPEFSISDHVGSAVNVTQEDATFLSHLKYKEEYHEEPIDTFARKEGYLKITNIGYKFPESGNKYPPFVLYFESSRPPVVLKKGESVYVDRMEKEVLVKEQE